MTRRKWTTAVQEEWLKSHLARFSDAQANKTTTKEFFPAILKEWRNAWPCPDPTPEEIVFAGAIEKATQKKRSEENARVRSWFHNHTRGTTSGNGARGLLKMKGKQKTLQEWQVYHTMTYESQWKAVIDEEWEKYQSRWKTEKPSEELDQSRFTFMNSFMRQKYSEESEEVQKNVKKRRDESKVELDVEGEDKNHAYQDAINRLPRTLAVWGESIKKQTGWNITFLAGGPSPCENGKIMSYTLHYGNSPDGRNFEGYLGKDGYDNHIVTPFDDFLHEAFPPEVCNSRSLGSKANTPEADEYEEKSNDNLNGVDDYKEKSNDDGEDVETDQDQIISTDADYISANRTMYAPGEYARIREANIAQNNELLSQMGLLHPQLGLGVEKKKKERKAKAAPGVPVRSSSRLGTKDSHMSKSDTLVACISTSTATTSEITVMTKEQDIPLINASPSLTAFSNLQSDATSANGTLISAESQEPHQVPELTTPASTLINDSDTIDTIVASASASATEPTSILDPMEVDHEKGEEAGTMDIQVIVAPSSAASVSPTEPTSNLNPMEVDHEKGEETGSIVAPSSAASACAAATEPTSNPDPMEVDHEKGEAHTSSSTNIAAVAAPAWLTTLNMDIYFQECSDVKAWQGLVQSLYKFEEENSINGNLPTTSRPEEVATWIKSKKKNSPPDVDAEKYGSSFMAWWIALQPGWRVADDGSFNYEVPEGEDWCVLHKGGKAGLYTVVVALSWWVRALTPDNPAFRAWKAVEDVQWVINQIATKCAPAGKKRRLEGSAPLGKSKKSRRG